MAVSVTTPGVAYLTNTPTAPSVAKAHAFMQAVDTHMQNVGMAVESFTGRYDPTGSDSQIPTTIGNDSAWMSYSFTDTEQATWPITISFAMSKRLVSNTNTNNAVWVPAVRISSGIDSVGAPLGFFIESVAHASGDQYAFAGDGNFLYAYHGGSSLGDFVRYTGDSLTVIIGMDSAQARGVSPANFPHIQLHIERHRDTVSGDPIEGFCGFFSPPHFRQKDPTYNWPGSYDNNYNCSTAASSFPSMFINYNDPTSRSTSNNHCPAGGPNAVNNNGSHVITPVYYKNSAQKINTLKRMFTAPSAIGSRSSILTLDFSGSEQKYLLHSSASDYGFTGLTGAFGARHALFEWE